MRRARWEAVEDEEGGGGEEEEDGAEEEACGGGAAPTAGMRLAPPLAPLEAAAPGRAATLSRHCIAICLIIREGRERGRGGEVRTEGERVESFFSSVNTRKEEEKKNSHRSRPSF